MLVFLKNLHMYLMNDPFYCLKSFWKLQSFFIQAALAKQFLPHNNDVMLRAWADIPPPIFVISVSESIIFHLTLCDI